MFAVKHTESINYKVNSLSDWDWWDSHRNVAACCQRTKLVLCVCVESAGELVPLHPSTHTHAYSADSHTVFSCVFRFWTVIGWCCKRWRKLQKPNTHQDKVHTNAHKHTCTHMTSCTNSASLCQITCLTWSSTLTRWRSCQSTVTQTERRRSDLPSVDWQTFLKSSSLPWRTWWVISDSSMMSQRSKVTTQALGLLHLSQLNQNIWSGSQLVHWKSFNLTLWLGLTKLPLQKHPIKIHSSTPNLRNPLSELFNGFNKPQVGKLVIKRNLTDSKLKLTEIKKVLS